MCYIPLFLGMNAGRKCCRGFSKIFCESSHLSCSEFLISWGLENREVYGHTIVVPIQSSFGITLFRITEETMKSAYCE